MLRATQRIALLLPALSRPQPQQRTDNVAQTMWHLCLTRGMLSTAAQRKLFPATGVCGAVWCGAVCGDVWRGVVCCVVRCGGWWGTVWCGAVCVGVAWSGVWFVVCVGVVGGAPW